MHFRYRAAVLALLAARVASVSRAPDPIAIDTWTNKGFGDDDIEDEANVLEPADFLWQKLDVGSADSESRPSASKSLPHTSAVDTRCFSCRDDAASPARGRNNWEGHRSS